MPAYRELRMMLLQLDLITQYCMRTAYPNTRSMCN